MDCILFLVMKLFKCEVPRKACNLIRHRKRRLNEELLFNGVSDATRGEAKGNFCLDAQSKLFGKEDLPLTPFAYKEDFLELYTSLTSTIGVLQICGQAKCWGTHPPNPEWPRSRMQQCTETVSKEHEQMLLGN